MNSLPPHLSGADSQKKKNDTRKKNISSFHAKVATIKQGACWKCNKARTEDLVIIESKLFQLKMEASD